jgi:hypothetical protein
LARPRQKSFRIFDGSAYMMKPQENLARSRQKSFRIFDGSAYMMKP